MWAGCGQARPEDALRPALRYGGLGPTPSDFAPKNREGRETVLIPGRGGFILSRGSEPIRKFLRSLAEVFFNRCALDLSGLLAR